MTEAEGAPSQAIPRAAPEAAPRAALRTARERARAELTREIKEEARRQLAATGADGLSLRAVARELGMVSSALYRYYPSRDELLTALIIDAYDALGEAAEQAVVSRGARAQWLAACHAIRDWAAAHPHEYALIYGSPIPGYRAPEATIGPASRVPLAFVGVVARASQAGELAATGPGATGPGATGPGATASLAALPLSAALADQAATLSAALSATLSAAGGVAPAGGPGGTPSGHASAAGNVAAWIPPDVLVRAVIAWTQLFGMISFELFGQFVGSFEPADALFAHAAAQLASFVGLP